MNSEKDNISNLSELKFVQIAQIHNQSYEILQTFNQSTITLGRNPACDVVFSQQALIVSRLHAMIIRRGNHYILKNLSPNGCYVNKVKKEECTLRQGDHIAFAVGGPVIEFSLCKQANRSDSGIVSNKSSLKPKKTLQIDFNQENDYLEPPTLLNKASADFTFQYGTTIKSFHQISIIVGKGQRCDFVIPHPKIENQQFQIRFREDKYILRDLSSNNTTLVNNENFVGDIRLDSGDVISLSHEGPKLVYLGEGRLSEFNPKVYSEPSTHFNISVDSSSNHTHHKDSTSQKADLEQKTQSEREENEKIDGISIFDVFSRD